MDVDAVLWKSVEQIGQSANRKFPNTLALMTGPKLELSVGVPD